MASEITPVDFHGDSINAIVSEDGRVLVGLRQLCRILKVDYDKQVAKLKGRSWAHLVKHMMPTGGGVKRTTMIDLRTLHGWLFSIDEKKVNEEMRPKLIRYQCECVDTLERHFSNRPMTCEDRPWASRFRESFAPHSQAVLSNFDPGAFTVITEGSTPMLMLEDELIRHMMEVRPGDRPCISIGLTWSHYRKNTLHLHGHLGEAPVWLPDRRMTVPVKVYAGSELHQFKTWLHFVYLPEKLQQYLDNKPEFKAYGSLPRASVANNTCRTITGRHAKLTGRVHRQLASCNGFVPASIPRPQRTDVDELS